MRSDTPFADASLRRGVGVPGIVLLVVAAAAPLTVIVGAWPMAVRMGGVGVPAAVLVAAAVLLSALVAIARAARRIGGEATLDAVAESGLGRRLGTAVVALTAFGASALGVAFAAFVGVFGAGAAEALLGVSVPPLLVSVVAVLGVGALGAGRLRAGVAVLAGLLALELALVAAVIAAALGRGAPEGVSLDAINPATALLTPGAGALFVIAFGAFIGFEGALAYAGEARRGAATTVRAALVAVAGLGLLYAGAFLALTTGIGPDRTAAIAGGDGVDGMVVDVAADGLGPAWAAALQLVLVTSFIACAIAFHAHGSRTLARAAARGAAPALLAVRRGGTPVAASLAITGATLVALVVSAALGADPYTQIAQPVYAVGVVAIVLVQLLATLAACASVRGETGSRPALAFGALGAAGLAGVIAAIALNMAAVSGTENVAVNAALALAGPLVLAAALFAPDRGPLADLGRDRPASADQTEPAPPATTTKERR